TARTACPSSPTARAGLPGACWAASTPATTTPSCSSRSPPNTAATPPSSPFTARSGSRPATRRDRRLGHEPHRRQRRHGDLGRERLALPGDRLGLDTAEVPHVRPAVECR